MTNKNHLSWNYSVDNPLISINYTCATKVYNFFVCGRKEQKSVFRSNPAALKINNATGFVVLSCA